ncbi:MAG: SDR family oxidoreductase [Bythopirellula sp.]|nr:SDR family oxidoreductase [Bythopirellula sp.]
MQNSIRTVLVTGCSTGIGRATVELLAARGFQVVAAVRDARHFAELQSLHKNIKPLLLDVTSEADVARAVNELRAVAPQGLYGLVNNAGVGLPSAVELTTPDELRQLFEVNTIAPLRLIQAFLPMLRQTRGRIVNVTSMNGALALPMVGAYSASKFALEALSDTLRVELRPWRISVSTVRPGQVRTAIFDKAGAALVTRVPAIPPELRAVYEPMYGQGAYFNERGVNSPTRPEAVSKAILRALTARWPRAHYHVGIDAHVMNFAKRYFPTRLLDRVLARVMGTLRRLD